MTDIARRALDIAQHDLDIALAILAEHAPQCEARAFGSRADGTAREFSDIDIALVGEAALGRDALGIVREAFQESDMHIRADVIDWHSLSDSFKEIVSRNYVVIQRPAQARGNLPVGWRETTIGDCAYLATKSVSPEQVGDVPYIGLEHIGENTLQLLGNGAAADVKSVKTQFQRGDTLFGKLRPYFRKVIKAPFDGICSTDIWVIRAKDGVCQDFLRYCVSTQSFVDHATTGSVGTRMPRANWDWVSRYEIPLPPLPEQRRIAGILGALDDKIALNRRMNATLEGMAQALFRHWFVDYEPVRAKMSGRWRRGESLAGMPADLWDAFPARLAPTALGEAPAGWGVRSVDECFNLTMGQSPPGHSYNDSGEGMPFFQGRAEFDFRYPQNRRYCTAPKRLAEPDDTLISVRAPVGTINMAYDRCCIGRGLAALRHKSGSASYTYYAIDALQPEIQQYEQTGTVFGAITKQQFEELLTLEPPPEIINAFDAYARHWDARIRLNTAQSRALTAMRDALLPQLLSGELRALW